VSRKNKQGMRTGFTTGACAAAAARAATLGLVKGRVPDSVRCELPNGQGIEFAVHEGISDERQAHAVVIRTRATTPIAPTAPGLPPMSVCSPPHLGNCSSWAVLGSAP